MDLRDRIEQLVTPTVEDLGFTVVRVRLSGRQRPRLQVMTERRDGRAMLVDDCAGISRAIAAVLEVEDPFEGAYTLEVSSPGIDRPLVRLGDFERFAGFEAKVETSRPFGGRRRFRGRLVGVAGQVVQIQVDGATMDLPYADIGRAKLLLTDELLAASEKRKGQ
jgi:ribosome maturation factor RimP